MDFCETSPPCRVSHAERVVNPLRLIHNNSSNSNGNNNSNSNSNNINKKGSSLSLLGNLGPTVEKRLQAKTEYYPPPFHDWNMLE